MHSVPDGNVAIASDLPTLIGLVEKHCLWVDPKTFKELPVWYPWAARGRQVYDSKWSTATENRARQIPRKETNILASKALLEALGVASPKPKNWTVCHIWGYDDPNFSSSWSAVKDPRFYTCIANMVWLPTPLKGLTDAIPEVKSILRTCAYYLYEWVCQTDVDSASAQQILSGHIPEHYPNSWPRELSSTSRPKILPLNDTVTKAIRRRKDDIRTKLNSPDLTHFPYDEVRDVLAFWEIHLD